MSSIHTPQTSSDSHRIAPRMFGLFLGSLSSITLLSIAITQKIPVHIPIPAQWSTATVLPLPTWVLLCIAGIAVATLILHTRGAIHKQIPVHSLFLAPALVAWFSGWVGTASAWNGLSLVLYVASIWTLADLIWNGVVAGILRPTPHIQEWIARISTSIGIFTSVLFATLIRFAVPMPFWMHLLLIAVAVLGMSTSFVWPQPPKHAAANTLTTRPRVSIARRSILIACIVATIIVGAFVRIESARVFSIQNDEYYHIDTAKGLNETGRYERWDWVENTSTGIPYIRTQEYTWLVAHSTASFGYSLLGFRLPVILFGILFLPLTAVTTWFLTRNLTASAIAVLLVTFVEGFIWSSVYTRMYSMFTVYTLVLFIGYAVAVGTMQLHKNAMYDRLLRLGLLLGLCIFCYTSRSIHDVMLLFIPALVLTSAVLYGMHRRASDRDAVLMFSILGAITLFVSFFERVIPFELITIRQVVEQKYLLYPFETIIAAPIAAAMAYSVLWWKGIPKTTAHWLSIIGTPATIFIVYFAFFADRYGAWKYAICAYILVYIILAWFWQKAWSSVTRNTIISSIGAVVTAIWVFVPVSYPGVPASPFIQKGYADKTYLEAGYHDYEKGYALIKRMTELNPNQSVYILLPRHYYLQNFDAPFTPLPVEKNLTVDILKLYKASADQGIIVTTADKEQIHFTPEVRRFLNSREFKKQKLDDTAFILYYWGQSNPLSAVLLSPSK